jgi:dTDP-glucose 4,6-dehydratase/UDP-glucuronate decarboxylase
MDFLEEEYKAINLIDFKKLKNKTILITGGNGLIGSNIVSYLQFLNKQKNLNLKLLVHSYSKPNAWLPQDENIEYFNSDLNDCNFNWEFDYLINTATYGQPKKFLQNKLQTIKLNTETYIKLLNMAKRNNACVLQMSSSEVYGQVPDGKDSVSEDFCGNVNTFAPRAVYGESKRLSETISKVFIDDGLDIKIIRLAIGYGAGVKYDDARFINEFIKKAINNGEIAMLDEGNALRQFSFITDTIEMILNVMLSGKKNIYNIGGLDLKSIKEIAETIAKNEGVKVKLPTFSESVGGKPKDLILDITRYTNEFGTPNFIPYEKGLRKTAEWIKLLQKENI